MWPRFLPALWPADLPDLTSNASASLPDFFLLLEHAKPRSHVLPAQSWHPLLIYVSDGPLQRGCLHHTTEVTPPPSLLSCTPDTTFCHKTYHYLQLHYWFVMSLPFLRGQVIVIIHDCYRSPPPPQHQWSCQAHSRCSAHLCSMIDEWTRCRWQHILTGRVCHSEPHWKGTN